MKSESTVEITKALATLQGELKPVNKASVNPYYKSKYADLSAIWESVRELLHSNGLAVAQLPQEKEGHIYLETLLLHTSGEWLSSSLLVTPGKPNDPQAVGSALTYARRYALSAMLGVCSEEDDDAESAVARQPKQNPVVQAAKEMGAVEAMTNAGEFLTRAMKVHKLNKGQVEAIVGPVKDLTDFTASWAFIEKHIKGDK